MTKDGGKLPSKSTRSEVDAVLERAATVRQSSGCGQVAEHTQRIQIGSHVARPTGENFRRRKRRVDPEAGVTVVLTRVVATLIFARLSGRELSDAEIEHLDLEAITAHFDHDIAR